MAVLAEARGVCVQGPPPLKKHWVLNQKAFDALLASLDRDRTRAAERYEQIRRALITFFECRRSTAPEDLADDTINRVARRLLEGRTIQSGNPASYFYGVARNVLKEYWDARGRAPASLESQPPSALQSPDPQRLEERASEREVKERRLESLDQCLGELSPEDRDLIRQYYQGETAIKIENRRRLAATLGIALGALRIRALRIRERLEACVERRLSTPARS